VGAKKDALPFFIPCRGVLRTIQQFPPAIYTKKPQRGTLSERSSPYGGTGGQYNGKQAADEKLLKNTEEECIMYFDTIAKIVSKRTGCDAADVKPESKFSELGIDSLDTVELLLNLEDEIGIEIELDQKIETVDDLDKFIQSKQG
jgi:acyl carrier protein